MPKKRKPRVQKGNPRSKKHKPSVVQEERFLWPHETADRGEEPFERVLKTDLDSIRLFFEEEGLLDPFAEDYFPQTYKIISKWPRDELILFLHTLYRKQSSSCAFHQQVLQKLKSTMSKRQEISTRSGLRVGNDHKYLDKALLSTFKNISTFAECPWNVKVVLVKDPGFWASYRELPMREWMNEFVPNVFKRTTRDLVQQLSYRTLQTKLAHICKVEITSTISLLRKLTPADIPGSAHLRVDVTGIAIASIHPSLYRNLPPFKPPGDWNLWCKEKIFPVLNQWIQVQDLSVVVVSYLLDT